MEQSVLKSTKKILGVGPDDTSFDLDIITHINSAFSILNQLGVGPDNGFAIEDGEATWNDFIASDAGLLPWLSLIKTCVHLRVRMLFDPPTTSYAISAMERQIQEHEWRLSTLREGAAWTLPEEELPEIVDGGEPG